MSLPARIEVLGQAYAEIRDTGSITLSNSEIVEANAEFELAKIAYERVRRKVLRHEIRHFRTAIFGGSRLGEDSPEFRFVTQLTKTLVEAMGDIDIVTGGGPGIMEAAHLGTKLAIDEAQLNGRVLNAKNLGITITTLSHQEDPNKHIHFETRNPEFPIRLQTFLDKTDAAYHAQGGIGTLLELALLTQTKQVGHLEDKYPLLAHPFWEPIVESWNKAFYHQRKVEGSTLLISEKDLTLVKFTDNIPGIVDVISKSYDHWDQNIRPYIKIVP